MRSDRPTPNVLDGELRADALDVLWEAVEWRLTGRLWSSVEAVVAALTGAWRSGDIVALRAAVYELELAGPVRATAIGDTPIVEPPDPVREEINELIFALDGGEPRAG